MDKISESIIFSTTDFLKLAKSKVLSLAFLHGDASIRCFGVLRTVACECRLFELSRSRLHVKFFSFS